MIITLLACFQEFTKLSQKVLVITIFIFGVNNVISQVNIDSLKKVWNDETQADTSRLEAIGTLVEKFYLHNNPDTAISMLELQYNFAKDRGSKTYMAKSLSQTGFANLLKSEYFLAIKKYQECLKVSEEINDEYLMSGALNGIGIIYLIIEDFQNALIYFERALALNKTLNNHVINSGISINMANCHYELGNIEIALRLCNKGIQLSDSIGHKRFLGNGLDLRGKIYLKKGNYTLSNSDYEKAKEIFSEIGDITGIGEASANQGTLFNLLKKYDDAIDLCTKSLETSTEIGYHLLQKISCECLYTAYKMLGDEKQALSYHELLMTAKDSLQMQDASNQLQLMEFNKLELLVEQEHLKEVARKNQTRNILIGSGIFLFLLSGGFFSRWRYVKKSNDIISKEKERSDNLLLNILPAEIAEELKLKGSAVARDFEQVSILFTDFKEFTQLSELLIAKELVAEINDCFKAFDEICEKYKIEKIKTIGDSYMAAGGLPIPYDYSTKNTVLAALEMQKYISNRKTENKALNKPAFDMRVGIHTGHVVAGIVGVKKFQYDIWGDTVNTASRMESNSKISKVNISNTSYELIKDDPTFKFENRGHIDVKGKGHMEMWFVSLNTRIPS